MNESILQYPWIILFAPLAATVVITLLTQRWKMLSALLSISAVLLGFVLSLQLLLNLGHLGTEALSPPPLQWLVIGDLVKIEFGATIDRLSILMLLVVTGVGSAIHIYSLGYMKGDAGCLAVFCLPVAVHFFDARYRALEQFHPDLHFLGTGRVVHLPADRVLVRKTRARPKPARKRFSSTASAISASCSAFCCSGGLPAAFNFDSLQVRLPGTRCQQDNFRPPC